MSNSKAVCVKNLALKVNRGEVEIYKLDKLDDRRVVAELVSVKGISRWTAEMFLMFSLARPDIFPVGDLALKKSLMEVVEKGGLTDKEIYNFAKRWGPYRTVASWYLRRNAT